MANTTQNLFCLFLKNGAIFVMRILVFNNLFCVWNFSAIVERSELKEHCK